MSYKVLLSIVISTACIMHTLSAPVERLDKESGNRVVYVGDDIRLPCEADGSLNPVFHWLHNNRAIEQSPLDIRFANTVSSPIKHELTKTKAELLIANANINDSGKYTCVADSLTKRVSHSFTVTVRPRPAQKPIETGSSSSPSNALRIYQHTDSVYQVEGDSIYVMCRATQGITNPVPSIRWTIRNSTEERVIEEDSNVTIHKNGDLEISHADVKYHFMEGSLYCNAIGEDGQIVKKEIFVYVTATEKSNP